MKPRRFRGPRHNGPRRSTPAGQHRPVLLQEVLAHLDPKAGELAVDCTLGFGGHSLEILKRIGPEGKLISFDLDPAHLPQVEEQLRAIGHPYQLVHGNFAGIEQALAGEQADVILADLGMSSMQVDDPERGFSYSRDGALDMRMDPTRGRSLAQVLGTISVEELAEALQTFGDEPAAEAIAKAIVAARDQGPIERTSQLSKIITQAVGQGRWQLHPSPGTWNLHPAARTFQALRILVNRELANLNHLLRVLPGCLKPGGRVGIISFHSGEDRLVKAAFRDGQRLGTFSRISEEAVRATFQERTSNPRSRSAKLRWAVRSETSS